MFTAVVGMTYTGGSATPLASAEPPAHMRNIFSCCISDRSLLITSGVLMRYAYYTQYVSICEW